MGKTSEFRLESHTEGGTVVSTTADQGVPSEEITVVIYMDGASKHADKVETLARNNGRRILLKYDNAETFKEAIHTDCSHMILLIEEQFSELLENEYRTCKDALKDLEEAEKDVLLISYLDDGETDLEVKYKLPKAVRKRVVHHTRFTKSTSMRHEDLPTTATQVGNNNHIEVRPSSDSTGAQQMRRNTFSASNEHTTTAAQVGNNNHIEVKPGAVNIDALQVGRSNTVSASSGNDNIDALQMGRNNTFSTSSGPSIQGYKLTITTPEANYKLCVQIKKHIDSNTDEINLSLKPLNTRIVSTDLGSVIIRVVVEPGTKLGPVWLREVITKILSEDIFAKLPKGTRMEVIISASLPLTPLDVDIFELKGEKWITDYRKDETSRCMLHQAAILGKSAKYIPSRNT